MYMYHLHTHTCTHTHTLSHTHTHTHTHTRTHTHTHTQQCLQCHQYFCSTCVRPMSSPYRCKRCEVFLAPVMERRQLEQLSKRDLSYYTRSRCILVPREAVKTQLVEIILHRQATDLNARASRALEQIREPPRHSAVGSNTAGQTGSATAQTGSTADQTRSRTGQTQASNGGGGGGGGAFADGGHTGSAGVTAEQVRAEVKRQKVRFNPPRPAPALNTSDSILSLTPELLTFAG